jgi:allantoinase
MKYDLLIRNGSVVRESGVETLDVAIVDGKIAELAPEIPGNARETIDATGLHVFPAVIDPHVHFNEPGRTEWEGISTGSAALAAGGGTLFFDMPLNSSPPVLDGPSFDLKLAVMREKSLTDFGLWGGLTPDNLDKLDELADRGVVGFKAFMCPSGIDEFRAADVATLRRGMVTAAARGLVVAVHAEDPAELARATSDAAMAGLRSAEQFLASRPVRAEVAAIQTAVAIARETRCPLHIVHVSSPDGARAAMFAGSDVDVTCETCPHYLTFTDRDLMIRGGLLKCAPPLRTEEDQRYLWAYLNSALIQFVVSDHSPAPPAMKSGDDLLSVWGGIAGVQSTLALLLSEREGRLKIPLQWISRMTSLGAAMRFKIPAKGRLEPGYDADVALVDLSEQYTLRREDLLDRHGLSPYVGRHFKARVRRTLVRGHTVFLDGKIVSTPVGKLVKPAP